MKTQIIDGGGTKRKAKVDAEGNLYFVGLPAPPIDYDTITRIYRQPLLNQGSQDMRVDGSVNPIDFYIESSMISDTYITTLSFVIADGGAELNEFGNLPSLTNGCSLFYEDSLGEIIIADQIQTNFDFIRLCQGNPAFGDAATAFRANNVSGSSEAYIPILDFQRVFGLPFGLRLLRGSRQRLTLRISDNVAGLDKFDCVAFGFERL